MRVYEGNIITLHGDNPKAAYLVEKGGKIEFTGDELPERFDSLPKIKTGPGAILPAFIDTHLHFSSYAFFSCSTDIRSAGNFTEMGKLIREQSEHQKKGIIVLFGASAYTVEEGIIPDRVLLDLIIDNRPVFIVKYDGHAGSANSKFIESMPKSIFKDRGFDEAKGLFFNESFFAAIDYITKSVSPVTLVKNMLRAHDSLAQKGISCIHSAEGVGFPRDLDVDTARLVARGANGIRTKIFFQTMDVSKVVKRKLPAIGGCFATALDGCFGSKDAALLEPYRDNKDNKGILYYNQEAVNAFVDTANRAGLQISLHAIGDAAFRQAVHAYEYALKKFPRDDHRHTIIHGCLAHRDDIERAAGLGLHIAAQPAFGNWDEEPLSYLESIIGDRAYTLNPLRSMLMAGLLVSGGSDAPCTLPDPLRGIASAMNHVSADERLTFEEALALFTRDAACAGFEEDRYGTFEPGKIFDAVFVDRDPYDLPWNEVGKTRVLDLYVSGKKRKKGSSLTEMGLRALFHR